MCDVIDQEGVVPDARHRNDRSRFGLLPGVGNDQDAELFPCLHYAEQGPIARV